MFTQKEFLIGLGLLLLIGVSESGKRFNQLWTKSSGHSLGEEAEVWESMISQPDLTSTWSTIASKISVTSFPY